MALFAGSRILPRQCPILRTWTSRDRVTTRFPIRRRSVEASRPEYALARMALRSPGAMGRESHNGCWRRRMSDQVSPEASAYVDNILDYRGATILAFAQVEWFLAKIILEAKAFDEYAGVDLSFSQDAEKRAAVVKKLLNVKVRLVLTQMTCARRSTTSCSMLNSGIFPRMVSSFDRTPAIPRFPRD